MYNDIITAVNEHHQTSKIQCDIIFTGTNISANKKSIRLRFICKLSFAYVN